MNFTFRIAESQFAALPGPRPAEPRIYPAFANCVEPDQLASEEVD